MTDDLIKSADPRVYDLGFWDPALDAAFKDFTAKMKARLIEKAKEGFAGWDKLGSEVLFNRMDDCMRDGDFVDAANFLLFAESNSMFNKNNPT